MWRVYAIGFGLMAVVMIIAGATLFGVTLATSGASGATPEWVWLTRAAVAVVLGVVAAVLAALAWRQSGRAGA